MLGLFLLAPIALSLSIPPIKSLSIAYRNSIVFDEPWRNRDVGVAGFVKLAGDYSEYCSSVAPPTQRSTIRSAGDWRVRAAGWIRVNTDAAMLSEKEVGLGVVFRDERGQLRAAASYRCKGIRDVLVAEAMAARVGLLLAKRLGYECVELECDAINVVVAVNNCREGLAPVDYVFDDIIVLGKSFEFFKCDHVKRCGNCVAHMAARLCPHDLVDVEFVDSFPQGLITLSDIDAH